MTVSQSLPQALPGICAHVDAVRPADSRGEPQNDASGRNMPRRMIAVTVALSEPADATPLDWADTIAANLRLIYRNTTVQIIDTWRTA